MNVAQMKNGALAAAFVVMFCVAVCKPRIVVKQPIIRVTATLKSTVPVGQLPNPLDETVNAHDPVAVRRMAERIGVRYSTMVALIKASEEESK